MSDVSVAEVMQEEPVKRGPGRPPKPQVDASAPRPQVAGVNITYLPKDGDPINTIWHKIAFRGNVPRLVADPTIIAMAKTNPWFEVEGHERAKEAALPDVPKTPEQYRAHANAWIKSAKTAGEMRQMLKEEAGLRDTCGVGSDDMELLMAYYEPRYSELKKAEAQ